MAKAKSLYRCSECGYETVKWLGKCPSCGEWNTLEEVAREMAPTYGGKVKPAVQIDLSRVVELKSIRETITARIKTGIGELDRVLGGGIVPGSVVLAGGEPGIGKSTLFLQMADKLAQIAAEKKAELLVVGLPKNMDGSEGFRAEHTRAFGDLLKRRMPKAEIIYFDERMTTMAAAQYMNITDVRGKKRKNSIDMLAAKIILQDYLYSKR